MRPDVDATTRTPTHLLCYAADDDLKPVWIKCAGLTGADALSDGRIQSDRPHETALRHTKPTLLTARGSAAPTKGPPRDSALRDAFALAASVLLAQWVCCLSIAVSRL